jgi:hypothetical protein
LRGAAPLEQAQECAGRVEGGCVSSRGHHLMLEQKLLLLLLDQRGWEGREECSTDASAAVACLLLAASPVLALLLGCLADLQQPVAHSPGSQWLLHLLFILLFVFFCFFHSFFLFLLLGFWAAGGCGLGRRQVGEG